MTKIFGTISQIGFVVRDIHESMRFWTQKNGVGPWFWSENVELGDFVYRGRPQNPGQRSMVPSPIPEACSSKKPCLSAM